MHKIFHAAALLILVVLEVMAQSSAPQVADGRTGPLALASERSRTNLLVGSLNVANFYDSNSLLDNENRLGDFTWSIQPQLTLLGTRRRSEEHTSELQSQSNLVCRLLLEKKKQ